MNNLHRALHMVRRAGMYRQKKDEWFNENYGICSNLYDALTELELLAAGRGRSGTMTAEVEKFQNLMDEYQKANRRNSIAYPVGGYVEYKIDRASKTMWLNPNRWQLLSWLLHRTV